MKVKFLRDYKVKAADGERYAAGDEVDLPEASARHFISRGAAEAVDARPKGRAGRAAEKPPEPAAE